MDPLPEYSVFLVRILEELDAKRATMSYQDLCKSLCGRLDLVHLAKLRSLLFYTACLDPAFPATLFKDKMRCSMDDPQSKKLMVAADIVTMFNLIQMNGGLAKEKLPLAHSRKFHKNQSLELCRSDDSYKYEDGDRGYEHMDRPHLHHHHHRQPQQQRRPSAQAASPSAKSEFIPASEPNFLLGVSKDMKCRAASLDKLHHLPQYCSSRPPSPPSPPSPPGHMQTTYFPMDVDSESTTDQESLQHAVHAQPFTVHTEPFTVHTEPFTVHTEPFTVHSCIHKRSVFKEDFHNLLAFSPQVLTTESKQGGRVSDAHRRELHKPATFFNHSFELPYSNPYFEPTLNSPLQDRRKAKHESLDDLQASTYFGPTTVSQCVSSRKLSSKVGKQQAWPVKSLSLNAEEGPPNFERPFISSKPLKENQHCNVGILAPDSDPHFHRPKEKVAASPGFVKKGNGNKNGIKPKDVMGNGPPGLDKREVAKKFRDQGLNRASCQGGDTSSSVGTQTEQAEQKTLKYSDRDRRPFKHSDDDSEIVSDDISDIFRFLDDMSVCDSLGIVQSSCYNSNGSLSQVTLKSEGDSSPERNTVKLAKSKLDRLFHSLENTDDELKSSVCKLVMRIGEIERKLESLSGVRSEISQVLSKLNKLDEKIQEPEANGRAGDTASASACNATPDELHAHPHPEASAQVFQCHTTGHSGRAGEWCPSDGSNPGSLRMKTLKKSLFTRRSSRSLNEESSAAESKVASITNSPRDWRTVSYSCHPGDEGKDKDRERDGKDRHRKSKEAERERQYELPQAPRPPKPPKESYLMEQVFTPHPFTPTIKAHAKGSPLYADLRPSSQPSWTMEEYRRHAGEKGKQLTALDLQTQDSLNPNNLEFWMEDVFTPGYDSLLKKKEAQFRRAKVCKIGALIAAAACTVILVIVVPICTMKS